MSQFQKGNILGKGRPKGSKNVKGVLPQELTDLALQQLQRKIEEGDSQAILFALNRVYPALKAVTPNESIEGMIMSLKLDELKRSKQLLVEFDSLFVK